MIGSLIGLAAQAASSIYAGMKSAQAAKEANARLKSQQGELRSWYDRTYNEDATRRADALHILNRTEKALRERTRAAAGRGAVMGGSENTAAAERASASETLANTASAIAGAAQERKDRIESEYLRRNGSLQEQLRQIELNRAEQISKAGENAAASLPEIGGLIDMYRERPQK